MTSSPSSDQPPSLDDDVSQIREAVTALSRFMSRPHAHDRVESRAGVQLDKVSEITMSCLTGQPNVDLRLSDIANRLGVELSSVSRKVQKLEDSGLVERTTDPNDARASRLHLTQKGQNLLQALNDARYEIFREVLSNWSTEDRNQMAQLFTRFLNDLMTNLGDPA